MRYRYRYYIEEKDKQEEDNLFYKPKILSKSPRTGSEIL